MTTTIDASGALAWRLRGARRAAYWTFALLYVLAVARGHDRVLASVGMTYLLCAPMGWHARLARELEQAGREARRHDDRAREPPFVSLLEALATTAVVAATAPCLLAGVCAWALVCVRVATYGGASLLRFAVCVVALCGGAVLWRPVAAVGAGDVVVLSGAFAWSAGLAVAIAWFGDEAWRRVRLSNDRRRRGFEALSRLAFRLGRHLPAGYRQALLEDSGVSAVRPVLGAEGEVARLAPARRWVSVCFVDVVGFTRITERLEPEELAALLERYQRAVTDVAARFGGSVDKFMGDGVMLLFGEMGGQCNADSARSCVLAAIAMRDRLPELRRELGALGLPCELRLRWGVASGVCTVGDFGTAERLHYTALGRTVNLASRLESHAAPDTIHVCERTAALVCDDIELRERPRQQLDGLFEAVPIFEAVADAGRSRDREVRASRTLETLR